MHLDASCVRLLASHRNERYTRVYLTSNGLVDAEVLTGAEAQRENVIAALWQVLAAVFDELTQLHEAFLHLWHCPCAIHKFAELARVCQLVSSDQ